MTDTAKWDDPWFRSLTPAQKLIFLFVIDRCNNAGFWERDDELIGFHTKLDVTEIEGAWEGLVRGLVGSDGWVWVKNFLKHQKNDVLSPQTNNAHKQIVALLQEQFERFAAVPEFEKSVGATKGLPSPPGLVQDKDTDRKGSAEGKPRKDRGTAEEVTEYFAALSLPVSDGEWFFAKCEGSEWSNNGQSIKDWKATVRSWKAAGYLPSQKVNTARAATGETKASSSKFHRKETPQFCPGL
jgi:hypothetical protein